MTEPVPSFDTLALAHLDAAYNLARWLVRDDQIAQDMVQDAYLRGLRYYASFRGGDIKPWLLGIVRNVCLTWLERHGPADGTVEFDDDQHGAQAAIHYGRADGNPETLAADKEQSARVNAAIGALPPLFREVLVLRELEGMSYDDVARVAGIPLGTVMSRLARARAQMRTLLETPAPAKR